MRRIGFIRAATALAVAAAALAATGAPASAASRPRVEMFTPRMLARMAPKGGVLHRMAALMPGATTLNLASLALFSDPTTVTVDGVSYQMGVSAYDLPAAFDQPPELAVELDRLTSAGGRLTGEQDHVYGYAPIGGMTVTANAALTHATVKTGTSISPSAVDLHFHASGAVQQTPCTLLGGGHGVFQVASGKLTATKFRVATGTTPFFGTITSAPATATVVHDPGCSSFMQAAARPVYRQQCPGRASLVRYNLTSFWDDELGFGGGRLIQFGVTESNPSALPASTTLQPASAPAPTCRARCTQGVRA